MTKEELLRERWEVISDYPGSELPIGCTLEFDQECCFIKKDGEYIMDLPLHYGSSYWVTTNIKPSKFSHIFNKLEWWQRRYLKDLPKYLKSTEVFPDPHIVEVTIHCATFFEGTKNGSYFEDQYLNYIPSSLEEYTEYLNKKK